MANPKHRATSSKARRRRSHHAIEKTTMSACKNCGAGKPSHVVCKDCGQYDGRKVAEAEKGA